MKRFILIAILSAVLLCSAAGELFSKKKKYVATYYHNKFNGRKTATGERFSNKKFSVATSNKAFFKKTIVFRAVTTGKKLILRCNDLMAPKMKNIVDFDLSVAAMQYFSDKQKYYPGKIELFIENVTE